MKNSCIKPIILTFCAVISTSESAYSIAEQSFVNKIHDVVQKIGNLDNYLHMTYPRSYNLGVAAALAGIAYSAYHYIVISEAKELLQECNYNLDKLAQNCPEDYQRYEKILKKLLIGSKDALVIDKRKQLLLDRIHDRLHTGNYWENLSNNELVDAESIQSKNEFTQLYQSDKAGFDAKITTIKQEVLSKHQALLTKAVEDHLSSIPWNEWDKQGVNLTLVHSLNDNKFSKLYDYHQSWADDEISRIRQEIAHELNKFRELYREKKGEVAPNEWSLKDLKRKAVGLGQFLLAMTALFGIMIMK